MLETTWPSLEIGLSHCITTQPWHMQRGGRWMSRPTAEKQQEGIPDMRPSTAAVSVAVESLHLYLGHWPGLTPGLTQVAQPHL